MLRYAPNQMRGGRCGIARCDAMGFFSNVRFLVPMRRNGPDSVRRPRSVIAVGAPAAGNHSRVDPRIHVASTRVSRQRGTGHGGSRVVKGVGQRGTVSWDSGACHRGRIRKFSRPWMRHPPERIEGAIAGARQRSRRKRPAGACQEKHVIGPQNTRSKATRRGPVRPMAREGARVPVGAIPKKSKKVIAPIRSIPILCAPVSPKRQNDEFGR